MIAPEQHVLEQMRHTLQLGRLRAGAATEDDMRRGEWHGVILNNNHDHAVVERVATDRRLGGSARSLGADCRRRESGQCRD